MVREAFLAALNHLLANEEWARAHLKPFAGQTARLELVPLAMDLAITDDGRFSAAGAGTSPAVTITLPANAPLRVLAGGADRSSLMASAQVRGSADLADCLGFVFRNLRWDVESDLATLVGDIAAHRLARSGKRFIDWQKQAAWNVARNLAEYLTEERPEIAASRDVARFVREVDSVAASLLRIEQRIGALEASRRAR